MVNALAILSALCLLEVATVGGHEVRRSSIFGFTIDRADVLEIEEAAARVEAPRRRRPGLVRLDGAAPVSPGAEEPAVEEPAPVETPLPTNPAADDAEPIPTAVSSEDAPLVEPPEDADDTTRAAYWTQRAERTFEEIDEYGDGCPVRGRCVSCPACDGGNRRYRGGCLRCDGRGLRAWVNELELTKHRPLRTDAERLAACFAIADQLRELNERQVVGARDLLGLALVGASPKVRTKALEQWKFMLDAIAAEAS